MRNFRIGVMVAIAFTVVSATAFAQCVASTGPGGACSTGPGGGLSTGSGGGLSTGPGNGLSTGPDGGGSTGPGEVCRLAKVVDFPPGQAGVYRQVQAEENQQVLMGFYLQVPAAAAQLAPARNNDKWNRANPDCK